MQIKKQSFFFFFYNCIARNTNKTKELQEKRVVVKLILVYDSNVKLMQSLSSKLGPIRLIGYVSFFSPFFSHYRLLKRLTNKRGLIEENDSWLLHYINSINNFHKIGKRSVSLDDEPPSNSMIQSNLVFYA